MPSECIPSSMPTLRATLGGRGVLVCGVPYPMDPSATAHAAGNRNRQRISVALRSGGTRPRIGCAKCCRRQATCSRQKQGKACQRLRPLKKRVLSHGMPPRVWGWLRKQCRGFKTPSLDSNSLRLEIVCLAYFRYCDNECRVSDKLRIFDRMMGRSEESRAA